MMILLDDIIANQFTRTQINRLTLEESTEQYKNFMSTLTENEFKKYDKNLIYRWENMIENHINHITNLFKRLKENYNDLLVFDELLGQFSEPKNTTLSGVQSIGDRHHLGATNYILTFKQDVSKLKKSIMYKPSPRSFNARVSGRSITKQEQNKLATETMRPLDLTQSSFLEILNGGFQDKYKLSTYLILPYGNTINESYAFEEYLEDNSFLPSNLKGDSYHLAETILKGLAANAQFRNTSVQTKIKEHINKNRQNHLISIKEKQKDYDNVFYSEEAWKCYSYAAGALAGTMLFLGLGDGHCENFILYKNKLINIDLDCYTFGAFHPLSTCLFERGTGGLNPAHNNMSKSLDMLAHLQGRKTIHVNEENRNCIYLYRDGELKSMNPDIHSFKSGFKQTLSYINDNKLKFEGWLENIKQENVWARYVHFPTSAFTWDRINSKQFDRESFMQVSYQFFLKPLLLSQLKVNENNPKKDNKFNMRKYLKDSLENKEPDSDILANNAIYLKESGQYIYDEYTCNSIPAFYIDVKQRCLYTITGKKVQVPEAKKINKSEWVSSSGQELIDKVDKLNLNPNFFPMSATDFIDTRRDFLSTHGHLKNLIDMFNKYLEEHLAIKKLPEQAHCSSCNIL
jgi:hypothetical protein